MFNISETIHFGESKCLYCQSICELECWSNPDNASTTSYTCKKCLEKFEFIYEDDNLIAFNFTCNTLHVVYFTEVHAFGIQVKKPLDIEVLNRVWVPEFEVNFKNKDSLFNRLNTCLLFQF